MTTLFSYLLTFIAVIFWFFRVIVTLLYQLEINFFAAPLNDTTEIIVLFATIPCILLVIKRNVIGAAAYLGIYGAYFGTALYECFLNIQETGFLVRNTSDLLILVIGVIIPILVFFDIVLNKNRRNFNADAKTKWFYQNEKYDREFDERADRNQYKF